MHSQFFRKITLIFITSVSHHPKIINDIIESISKTGRILKIETRSHDQIYVAFLNEMSKQDKKNHFLERKIGNFSQKTDGRWNKLNVNNEFHDDGLNNKTKIR